MSSEMSEVVVSVAKNLPYWIEWSGDKSLRKILTKDADPIYAGLGGVAGRSVIHIGYPGFLPEEHGIRKTASVVACGEDDLKGEPIFHEEGAEAAGSETSEDAECEGQRGELAEMVGEIGGRVVYPESRAQLDGWLSFCKEGLWPLICMQLTQDSFSPADFSAYAGMNRRFASEILKTVRAQGGRRVLVWVHDYHLYLVPQYLRDMLQEAGVGGCRVVFFQHSPFPSSEIFRLLPWRGELLQSLLCASFVGFQTFHDERHFVNSCLTILSGVTPYGRRALSRQGRETHVASFPVGISVAHFAALYDSDAVAECAAQFRLKFAAGCCCPPADVKIIVGRDRLDPIKGLPQKLVGFERFLEDYPEWRNKVVIVQTCLQPRNRLERDSSFQTLLQEVHGLVGRINGRFGLSDYMPIHLITSPLSPEHAAALFVAADACLLTSLREGMNLTSHEFVVAQRGRFAPLVLSKFVGSAQCLPGAMPVNPYAPADIAATLYAALTLPVDVRQAQFDYNLKYVMSNSALFWAQSILKSAEVDCPAPDASPEPALCLAADVAALLAPAKRRLLMLDYDGTLTPIVSSPELAAPADSVRRTLARLAADPRNIVYVVSGRDGDTLMRWLGKDIPVGLSAEHGCFFREAGSLDPHLQSCVSASDLSWKPLAKEMMEEYVARTPGSMLECKAVNYTFHYRNSPPEFADMVQRELIARLRSLAAHYSADVLVGKMAIEIRPRGVNKGGAVKRILARHPDASAALCIGDDRTDEDMFRAMNSSSPPSLETRVSVIVGSDHAEYATHRFSDRNQVDILLDSL